MRLRLAGFLFLSMLATGRAQTDLGVVKPARPLPAIERVLIISIDGLRPDRLLLADTPVLHGLIKGGTYTFWARTTAVSTTLPSHTSMLTAVSPRKHKIEWNEDFPFAQPVYPFYPTIFEMAKKAGYSTAFVSGKSKFEPLTKPGTVDYARVPEKDEDSDDNVGADAVRVIRELKPEVLFVHFPAVDRNGHKFGWGSPEQLAAIARVDGFIGGILAALGETGARDKTLVIVTADHGGQGKGHGPDDARSRHIPWIVNGPGVNPFYDLTQRADLEVRTEDTCATAAYVLGLSVLPQWDGKPVLDAFTLPPAP